MTITWVLATNNAHKLQEVRSILQPEVEILSLSDIGCTAQPDETGLTFRENALIKAAEISSFTNLPVLADDSGLCVKALQDKPGIHSARYAGTQATDTDNIQKLLFELQGVSDRTAAFVACICLYNQNELPIFFEGRCEGIILNEPSGGAGFGYDPVFKPQNYSFSFAELGENIKNQISHRAKALEKVKNYIFTNLVS